MGASHPAEGNSSLDCSKSEEIRSETVVQCSRNDKIRVGLEN